MLPGVPFSWWVVQASHEGYSPPPPQSNVYIVPIKQQKHIPPFPARVPQSMFTWFNG